MAYDGPRFRRDLISTVFYEGGVRCVDVHDPKRGATFRLFDYEYSVALAFDGRDLGKVISWVRVSTGLELNEEQLTAFAKRLDQLGFLEKPKAEGEVTPPPAVPSETPAPLPVPRAPTPPPPREEGTPPPEAGSMATATRPTSGERMASTGAAPPDETESGAAEMPESEPSHQAAYEPQPQPTDEAPPQPTDEPQPQPTDEAPPQPTDEAPAEIAGAPAPVPAEVAIPEESAVGPDETPRSPTPQEAEDSAAPAESAPIEEAPEAAASPVVVTEVPVPEPATQVPVPEPAEIAPTPEPATEIPAREPTDDVPAPEPATVEEPARVEAAPPESAPAPHPSSSEPELPVAVGPSPERPRERPAPRSARLPADAHEHSSAPASRRQITPPPIPRAHFTPTPLPVTRMRRGPLILSAFFGVLAAMVVGAVLAPFALGTRPPAPVPVRVMKVKPTEILRWLEATAPAEPPPLQTLSFPAGGKVLRIASPGLELRPGDVVAATEAARAALADWTRAQEQLAFAKQLVEGMRDSNDEKKIASAEAVVMQRATQEERMRAALAKLAITAREPSTVEQTLVNLGQTVQAGGAAVRLRLPGWRARFELPRLQVAQLHKQGLCQAEIAGRQVDCGFLPDEGDDTHLVIGLPAGAVQVAGTPVRLARGRALDAYLLPAAALSDSNGKPRVLVVAPGGRAEMRSVVLADRTPVDAVVTQGLDPGDAVVVESPRPVGAGTPVRVLQTIGD